MRRNGTTSSCDLWGLRTFIRKGFLPASYIPMPACSCTYHEQLHHAPVPMSMASLQLVLADQDMILSLGSLIVNGKLLIGSPTCRLKSKVVINFKKYDGMVRSSFGLLAIAGTSVVDIHGADFTPTWTRLAATVRQGSKTIKLQVCEMKQLDRLEK